MNRKLIGLTVLIAALLFTSLTGAQNEPTTDSVVALVMTVPEIADGLANMTDYQTHAYNSNNRYGIWQVEFDDNEGNRVAWAQVQPSSGKVFAWEAYFSASDDAYETILPVFQSFVANNADVRALIRDIDADELYPWWDGGAEAWVVWIGDADDAIMVAVQFDGGEADSTENPVLKNLWFPNLPDYDEWKIAASSQAVAIAFQETDIAIALRGKTWSTESELVDNGDTNIWTVNFTADGAMLVTATVDVSSGEILDYQVL